MSFCWIVINDTSLLRDLIGCTCIIAGCKFPSWSLCLMQYIWSVIAEKGKGEITEIGEMKTKIIESESFHMKLFEASKRIMANVNIFLWEKS